MENIFDQIAVSFIFYGVFAYDAYLKLKLLWELSENVKMKKMIKSYK